MEKHKVGQNGNQVEHHVSQTKLLHGIHRVSDGLIDGVDRLYSGLDQLEDRVQTFAWDAKRWWNEFPKKTIVVAFLTGALTGAWLMSRSQED